MPYTDVKFADGFESGNLSAGGWTLLADGSAVVEAAAAHSGSFGLRMTNVGSQAQFLRKNLGTPIPNVSLRFWVRMGAGAAFRQIADCRDAGGGHLLDLYWDGGASRFTAFVFKQAAGGSVELDSPGGSVPVDTWTQVELQVDCSPGGVARLLVNGVSVANVTDNFDRASDVSLLTLYNADGAFTASFDEVQVAAWEDVVADTTPPTAPSGLSATPVSGTRVDLAWTAATDNVGVTLYRVERDGVEIATTPSLAYSDTGASAGLTYDYRVRAQDAALNLGAYSNFASATTPAPDTTAPSAPGTLNAAAVSPNRVSLSWGAATDAVGVAHYLVERDNVQVVSLAGNVLSYSDPALQPSTVYTYRVRAVDAAGNIGAYSNVATVTTPPADVVAGGPETLPTVRQLKAMIAGYITDRVPTLTKAYPFEPGNLRGFPCVTLLSRRYDAVQAETGPHDQMTYEFRLRLYVRLGEYEAAQDEIDDLIPLILDVPRHHFTMEGDVDFLVFYDSGSDIEFSKDDGWAFKDLTARVVRDET